VLTPRAGLRDAIRRLQGGSLDRGSADNLIQAPHIKRRLQRGLNLKEIAPVPALSSELVPVILVDDLTHEKTDSAREWITSAEFTSGVGNLPHLEFSVPDNAAYKCHISAIWINVAAAQAFRWKKRSVALGTAIVNQAQTPRGKGLTSTSPFSDTVPFVITKVDGGVSLSTVDSHAFRFNTTFAFVPFDLDVVSGETFVIMGATVNSSIEVALSVEVTDLPA